MNEAQILTDGTNQAGDRDWQRWVFRIVFQTATPGGRAFDLALIVFILASVGVIMLESVAAVHARYGELLFRAEWVFTVLFLSLIHISEPTRRRDSSRMPSSA